MKFCVKWSRDTKIPGLSGNIPLIFTKSTLIIGEPIKFPSYLVPLILREIEYGYLIDNNSTCENILELEKTHIGGWDGEWVELYPYLIIMLKYPTSKILSNRKLEENLINFYREKQTRQFILRDRKNRGKSPITEFNTEFNLPLDIRAFSLLKTLSEYKWKEK